MATNLKQQFIKMANVILSQHPEFYLVENYQRPYCDLEPEGNMSCDHESDENCKKCQYQKFENIDVQILIHSSNKYKALYTNDYDMEYSCYSFDSTDKKAILNEDDMYSELSKLYERLMQSIKYNLEWYQKYDHYEKYAHVFFKKVVHDFRLVLNKDILPIKFYQEFGNDKEAEDEQLCGELKYMKEECSRQHIIKIFQCEDRDTIYQTIRHEILHYVLYVSYLKNDDDDGIFHALCKIYDAGAYKPMNNEQQLIYDQFLYIYDNIDELIKNDSIKDSKKMVLHYMLRYLGRIPWDVNEDFEKYAESLYKELMTVRV